MNFILTLFCNLKDKSGGSWPAVLDIFDSSSKSFPRTSNEFSFVFYSGSKIKYNNVYDLSDEESMWIANLEMTDISIRR